jgi:hypothetical protein
LAHGHASFRSRHRVLLWAACGLLAVLVALGVAVAVVAHRAEPFVRARIVEGVAARFHARVELDSFHISLGNSLRGEWGLWAEGRGLRIWPPARVEGVSAPLPPPPIQPLIRLDEFRFHVPLRYEPGAPVFIPMVELKGLAVDMPPRSHFLHAAANASHAGAAGASQPRPGLSAVRFHVDSIVCRGAQLVLENGNPEKLPVEIDIAQFKLTGISTHGAMHFDADLTNPRPRGAIHTMGDFGPWQVDDPGESAVSGEYRFDHADLADFKGIAGILSSTGHYRGTLRDLAVDGETDTPDFRLSHFDNVLALHTQFHARVDGTDGDTWLDDVDATLGRSHLQVQGKIVRVLAAEAGGPLHSIGHDIALTVNVDRGRIEDFVRLASKGPSPLLTGNLNLKTTLHIPPGPTAVHERMKLNGQFRLDEAKFASEKIQDRIESLSLRGQGRPGEVKTTDSASMRSQMQGDFRLADGVVTLPSLTYTVPGAVIQLKGTYGLEGGALAFTGTAKTQATVSQMVGGWKGLLLKPADRFFKKDGAGTEVLVHIGGTREKPEFGINFDRMKSTVPQQPGQNP